MEKEIEVTVLRKGCEIGKNFLASGACFIIFSTFVAGVNMVSISQTHAYLFGGVAFFVASLAAKLYASNFLRGFPIYVSLLVVPSLAFPLDDLGYLPAENMMILAALLSMTVAMCVIWIRIIRYHVE